MAETPPISDWTNQLSISGCLTRKHGKTAIVDVTALVEPVQEADENPETANTLVQWGQFRLNAMDDGQPDPVHVGNLLMNLLERPGRHVSVFVGWGQACVGMINRPKRGAAYPAMPTLMFLPPAYVRAAVTGMNQESRHG